MTSKITPNAAQLEEARTLTVWGGGIRISEFQTRQFIAEALAERDARIAELEAWIQGLHSGDSWQRVTEMQVELSLKKGGSDE